MTNHEADHTAAVTPHPPIDPSNEYDEPESRWPKVMGILAIVYAALGLTCLGIGTTWLLVLPLIPEMFRGGMVMPAMIKYIQLGMAFLGLIAGILLLRGGIRLVRRRRSGVGLMKGWAVYRLILVFLSMIVFAVTTPAQLQMARSRYEFANRMRVENNMPEEAIPNDDVLYRQSLYGAVIGAVAPSIFPLFVGFYLSRRKITEEVNNWQ